MMGIAAPLSDRGVACHDRAAYLNNPTEPVTKAHSNASPQRHVQYLAFEGTAGNWGPPPGKVPSEYILSPEAEHWSASDALHEIHHKDDPMLETNVTQLAVRERFSE